MATLGYVHEEGGAFVNRSGAPDARDQGDEDAAGLALIVARALGNGFVAGIGTAEQFRNPTQGEDGGRTGPQPDALVTSLLRTATSGEVDASDATSNDGTSSPVGRTSTPGQPGFGVGTALGAFVGVASLVRWLLDDD